MASGLPFSLQHFVAIVESARQEGSVALATLLEVAVVTFCVVIN